MLEAQRLKAIKKTPEKHVSNVRSVFNYKLYCIFIIIVVILIFTKIKVPEYYNAKDYSGHINI